MTRGAWVVASSSVAFLLVIAAGIGFAIAGNSPAPGIDRWWESLMLSIRNPVLTPIALFLDFEGNGIIARVIVPVIVIGVLLILRRPRSALFVAVALIVSVVVVQTIKQLVGRARPPHALVTSDFGSFPSGHVANAVTLAVALALVTRLAWVWFLGAIYSVAMLLSRTYLGIHWLSDTVAAGLLGAALTLTIAALLSSGLEKERARLRKAR